MIPILRLDRQYDRLKDQFNQALVDVAASGAYILGPNVQAFEQEMAEYLNVKHVIGCASGTDALLLALKALKIGAGDEVITTPFTYIATSESIVQAGATPVFVDVDPNTFNMDVSQIASKITPQTKAIMPVHLYGLPANMAAIQLLAEQHGLAVIEDCAQAIGATINGQKVGTIGDIGCFSFFPTKNLGCMGDGGMVTTNDNELADRLRMLRVHGSKTRYYHEEAGLNSRLDEMHAAILRIKLRHIDEFNQARNRVATAYTLGFNTVKALQTPSIPDGMSHVFHQYTVKLNTIDASLRDKVQQALNDQGVGSMIYYPVPCYAQQTHANLHLNPADFPVCEALKAQVFSLPMFPELTDDEVQQVIRTVSFVVNGVFQTQLTVV